MNLFKFLVKNFKKGISKVGGSPQLFYTFFIAIIIISSFLFMADRFASIARDAQERLINIRIGSIQDAFATFAGDNINNPNYLNQKISEIVESNETIQDFYIVSKENVLEDFSDQVLSNYNIISSSDTSQIGQTTPEIAFLYGLASGSPENSITIPIENYEGRLFQTARALNDPSGNVVGVVISVQTLSQADKLVNDKIRDSFILLSVILCLIIILFLRHSKIIDYMELYKKLQGVDQLKDDFISMASHELRSPLTTIRGYAEFIREAPELLPETKDFALKIDISAKSLDSLVADILDVSKIQQGRMSYKLENIQPTSILEEIANSYIIPAKDKGLKISFDRGNVTVDNLINADIARLKQVFVNFIGNAVKYTKEGEIIVKQYIEDNRFFVRIIDTGIGMSEEERKKLFEKFYRIRNNDTEDIRGTGLGLWITAQIVSQLNGTISVESIKGVGSHFIVSFPLSAKN